MEWRHQSKSPKHHISNIILLSEHSKNDQLVRGFGEIGGGAIADVKQSYYLNVNLRWNQVVWNIEEYKLEFKYFFISHSVLTVKFPCSLTHYWQFTTWSENVLNYYFVTITATTTTLCTTTTNPTSPTSSTIPSSTGKEQTILSTTSATLIYVVVVH